MKKIALTAVVALALTPALFGAETQTNPTTETPKITELTGGWKKLKSKLPVEMQAPFETTMLEIINDEEIQSLKKQAEAAAKLHRETVQNKLAEKNPEIAKKIQDEIQKWRGGLKTETTP